MAQNAADLAEKDPEELGATWHFELEEPLDGEHEGVLLVHRRGVVEPVEVRNVLDVGARLDQLLRAAVEQPDVRVDALDDFAVELQHQAQHAVGGGVLRPEVDGKVADGGRNHLDAHVLGKRGGLGHR